MDTASRVVIRLDKGEFNSVKQAAKTTSVPRSTLRDRRAGIQPHGREEQPHARLTRDQEDSLAAYIRDLQLQYAPINQTQLAVVAQAMARQNEPNARLGVNWISRFIKKRPELRTGKNQALSKSRIEAAIPSQIEGWFTHLSEIVLRFNIHPQDI
jgi:Tc5 transposase DNA-binding domain